METVVLLEVLSSSADVTILSLCALQWGEHYAALSRLAVGQTLMVNKLLDMEWKFGGKNNENDWG